MAERLADIAKRLIAGAATVSLTMAIHGVVPTFAQPRPVSDCRATPADQLGPFYKPSAPQRERVDFGFALAGAVRSSDGCRPIQGAEIEFWLAGPSGRYDDAHRATVKSDAGGSYRFECNVPPAEAVRPPHIHLRVTAPGFRTLVTQFYPQPGSSAASFDIVLAPA